MTKSELLSKAILKYPVGTKCICTEDDKIYTISSFRHDHQDSTQIWFMSGMYGVRVYNKGKWAKIIK